jgi:hypothetical protein
MLIFNLSFDEIALDFVHIEESRFDYYIYIYVYLYSASRVDIFDYFSRTDSFLFYLEIQMKTWHSEFIQQLHIKVKLILLISK